MESKEIISAPATPQVTFMDMIAQNINNPNFDAAKLHSLIDANERIMNRQAMMDYDAAMVRLQAKLADAKITKTGKIEFSGKDKKGGDYHQSTPYAKLEDIDKVLRPLMRAEGFVVTYLTSGTERPIVTCKITHDGGHSETSSMTLPLDTSGSKNNLQGAGSSISYGRRYTLCAMLNLITPDEDDDGAGGPITDEQAALLDGELRESKMDRDKFLKLAEATDIREIKLKNYGRALNAVQAKILANKRAKEKEKADGKIS